MRLQKLFIFFLILIAKISAAQTVTEIFGKVSDATSKEALPYVNVHLYGGVPRATMTDPKGEFRIRTLEKVDSIVFSYIGYRSRNIKVKRGGVQELNVEMGSDELKLIEITVKAGKKKKRVIDTTANYVFYQVLKHKEQNRVNNLVSYKYQSYDKFQLSLMNPGKKLLNFFLFKPFRFVFENKDTTETGSTFIPGLIRETFSDVYCRNHPRKQQRTIVQGDKMTGVDNPSVGNMVSVEFRETDPYDNLFYFARTYFNAPFSNIGTSIYYYYLTDTAKINGRVSYKLHFVGKSKEDLALKGFAWIDSATWAIQSIVFRPNEKANLNFVNEYDAKIQFTLVNGKYWMKSREEMRSLGSLFKNKNKLAMLVEKLVEKKNFETDILFPDSIFQKPEEITLADSARNRSKLYWDTTRLTKLTPSQQRVFEISDTIKTVPAWKTYEWLGVFFTTAYADAGPFSIGRVLNFGSRNNVEGWRVRFGFETNPRFLKRGTPGNNFLRKFYFTAYGAYGFKDKDFKYLTLMRINLPRKNDRWQSLEAYYRYDIRVPGQDESQTLITFDNIVTLISGSTLSKVMKVREVGMSYEKDWIKDFSTLFSFTDKIYYNIPGVSDFARDVNGIHTTIPNFNVTEFMIDTRYSPKTLSFNSPFYRYFQITKYPVFSLRYTLGYGAINNDNFTYHNLQFTVKQRLSSAIGYTDYSFKAAKIFGRVPYTASYISQGNLGILLDKFNYNLVRQFEFVSDQYAQLWIEHHFNGFFFNKIPGFSKLKLREVIIFKSLIGSFSQKNADLLSLPTETSSPGYQYQHAHAHTPSGAPQSLHAPGPVPYIELGFGIENIAYMFRIDFLWRATYRAPGGQNFGVKLAFKPNF